MKIAWLTDVQAPYREPLWRELTAAADFEIFFTFREEKVRHWVWRHSPDYRSRVVPAWTVPLPGPVARRLDEPMAWLEPGSAKRILHEADVLLIQNWWQPANLWCAWLGRRRGIPYIMHAESTLESRRFARGPLAWLRSLVFRHAGAVVVPGPAAGAAVVADGTPAGRVVESVNSIDLTQFDHRVRELRDGTAAADPEHRFLYVGQLIERKNVGALIRAFAGISAKATLDIAGDGVEMDALRALARSLGVEDRVRFHGFLDEPGIVELLSRTHTLVLPSTEEVYGFTALEAYVAGLQVIVSARAGIAPNLEGKAGTWIVEPAVGSIQEALGEARDAWAGWQDDVDVDFASPRRAAADIVRAAEIART
jgi:glycosyltransferase involved in cell wall biosynthesis